MSNKENLGSRERKRNAEKKKTDYGKYNKKHVRQYLEKVVEKKDEKIKNKL
jgi:hypothetical protein